FDREVVAIDAPNLNDEGKPDGTTHRVQRDEGMRETTMEGLAKLKPVAREDGVHTAGTSSQISDAAAAGLKPRAKLAHQCLVGTDPVLMLTGPIDATRKILDRAGMTMADIDTT